MLPSNLFSSWNPCLKRSFNFWIPSILKWWWGINSFNFFRLIMGLCPPLFFGTRKMLERKPCHHLLNLCIERLCLLPGEVVRGWYAPLMGLSQPVYLVPLNCVQDPWVGTNSPPIICELRNIPAKGFEWLAVRTAISATPSRCKCWTVRELILCCVCN